MVALGSFLPLGSSYPLVIKSGNRCRVALGSFPLDSSSPLVIKSPDRCRVALGSFPLGNSYPLVIKSANRCRAALGSLRLGSLRLGGRGLRFPMVGGRGLHLGRVYGQAPAAIRNSGNLAGYRKDNNIKPPARSCRSNDMGHMARLNKHTVSDIQRVVCLNRTWVMMGLHMVCFNRRRCLDHILFTQIRPTRYLLTGWYGSTGL